MRESKRNTFWFLRELLHKVIVLVGAAAMMLVFFLVLPLMQTLNRPLTNDLTLQTVDTAKLEAPPPPPEEEKEPEPEPDEAPPELAEEAPPLDLAQLELALNPGFGDGWTAGDFVVKLNTGDSGDGGVDALFSLADLDQKPRVLYQPGPLLSRDLRRKAPGTVQIIFIVDQQGRVENPAIQASSDPIFEKPALAAVKQWKFEPGKRNGQPVRFRMRVPITFPQGN